MPNMLIRDAIGGYALKLCKSGNESNESIAEKAQALFAEEFKMPTQEEIERVEASFASTPKPDKRGESDLRDSHYTPLGNEEKERRRALQPLAVTSLCQTYAAVYNKKVDSSGMSDPRQAFTLLHPDHPEEHQQFLDDWKKSEGNEKENAKLMLKAAKWLLARRDDEVFRKELSNDELVKEYPKLFQYSIGAGELSNAFRENSPLVRYGLISEKDRQVMGKEINRLYEVNAKAISRMELLANPLYAEANLDDVMKNSDNGSTQKLNGVEKVGDFGHALSTQGRTLRAMQFRHCMDELQGKHDCHEKECNFFNLAGEEIKGEELENTVRRGDMFLVSDASRDGQTEPCMWQEKTGVLTGRDAMNQMRNSENYPNPGLWHRFLNAISPKLLEAMYGEEAVETVKRWHQREMVMEGRSGTKFKRILDDTRKQSLALKPNAKEAREERRKQAGVRQKQSLDARKANMKEKRTEMMEKARGERGLDNNLKNMEYDCIHDLSEVAGNGTIRTYDENLSSGEKTPLLKIAGRALFFSHLQDVQKNGTPEQKQALDDLDREGFEKLYDSYTKTEEFRFVQSELEGSDKTLAFMIPLDDIATINGAKYKDPSAVGEKEFKAFQSMIDEMSRTRRDYLKHRSSVKPFDLKAELGKMAEQKQGGVQKVGEKNGLVTGDKPAVNEEPKLK